MKQLGLLKNSFICTILGFVESHSGSLGDVDGYIQLIPGTYKNRKTFSFTSVKIHLKADCINGSILNGTREPIWKLLLSINHLVMKYTRNLE